MSNEKDLRIIRCLRSDARKTLATIAREAGIPQSTVYDRIRKSEKTHIKKHTSLVDFSSLGYKIRVQLLAKANDKRIFRKFIEEHGNVNSAFRIDGEYDFFMDCVFASMKDLNEFNDEINARTSERSIFYVIDEIKLEDFLNGGLEG